ncbi:MAG: DUF2970 domain-containing protein [Comamonas sp.]|jgi:hypothetical protein|uniref:DUF2970 domain-containing protein n=1 Tax=Comamonas sp. TaxID=34028 RepID=UPI0028375AF6|nr:DUF2970 domain-containing protein [Comamonas sp.]MDR0212653.1 DUF2970 domain-containing protein [Comamonas sp.]MDR2297796.1 DUF2970 domain-containing protein [Comamonas sp.]
MTQTEKKPAMWRTIVAVCWAMLGVRKGKEYEKDFASITPLHVIAVGLVAIVILVLALIWVVNLVV